jgi:4'-phosphopantetheinyl transferase
MNITYLMKTDRLNDDDCFWDSYHSLSPLRQKKIDAFINRKDRNLSLAAGLLLQVGLAEYGLHEKELLYERGANGKPFIPKRPDIHFSISHSETAALCSFSDCQVGADIEKITAIDLEIAKHFFINDEYQRIKNSENPCATFFDYWVLKESYQKLSGRGLKLPLNAFSISFEEQIRVYENTQLMPCSFLKKTVFDDFTIGICIEGNFDEKEMILAYPSF